MGGLSKVAASNAGASTIGGDYPEAGDLELAASFHDLLQRQAGKGATSDKPILLAQNTRPSPASTDGGPGKTPQAPRPQAPSDDVNAQRRAAIGKWVQDNASPNFFSAIFGGSKDDRLKNALEGHSDLGRLSSGERSLLVEKTVGQWRKDGDTSAVENFGKSISGHGDLSRSVGSQLANISASAMGAYFNNTNNRDAANFASSTAMAAATATGGAGEHPDISALRGLVNGMGGREAGNFGDALAFQSRYSSDASSKLGQVLTALNQGPETQASSQFTLHAFASADSSTYRDSTVTEGGVVDIGSSAAAAPMAAAVARLMHPGDAKAQAGETQRLTAIMTSPAGAKLFAPDVGNDAASSALRMEVFNTLKAHPEITADSLTKGDSPWMARSLAQPLAEKAAQTMLDTRGDAARVYGGTNLDNMVGTAMHLKPSDAPKNETPKQQEAREKATAEGRYSYFDQEPVTLVRNAIRAADTAMGGDGNAPNVTVLPVQVSTPDHGPIQLPLFRVDRQVNGKVQSQFVDNTGARYTSFNDWRTKNALPDGVMSYPEQGHLTADAGGKVKLQSEDTPETHNTWHHVRGYIDAAVLVGGIVAGTALTFGVGGLAITAVAVGAGVYGTARAGENLAEMSSRNQSLNPLSSSEARANWLTAAAGVAGSGGMLVGRATQAAAEGGLLTRTAAASLATGTRVVGVSSDALAMGNQMRDAALHWDQMSPNDKIVAGLSFAFWGVSAGAQAREMYNFRALQQRFAGIEPAGNGAVVTPRTGGDVPPPKTTEPDAPIKLQVEATVKPPHQEGKTEPKADPVKETPVTPPEVIAPPRILKSSGVVGPDEIKTLGSIARGMPEGERGAPLVDMLRGENSPPPPSGPSIIIRGRSELNPHDGHRHEGAGSGTYQDDYMHSNYSKMVEVSDNGNVKTLNFPVSPHLFDRGVPQTTPGYYLKSEITAGGGRVLKMGRAVVEGDNVVLHDPVYNTDGAPKLLPGSYSREDFEALLGTKIGNQNEIEFVASPTGSTLGYPGVGVDHETIGVQAARISKELNEGGASPTMQSQLIGLTAGNPYDPAAYRFAYDTLHFTNKTEAETPGLTPGSLKIAGYGEITISKEMVQELVGMPKLPQEGQPAIDALSQYLSPMRYAGGTTIIHCDAGQPKAARLITQPAMGTFQGESDLSNVPLLTKLFQQNPDQQFIWAHAGASNTSTMPANYMDVLRGVLDSSPNVKIDLSWDVTNRWIQGSETWGSGNKIDTNRVNSWAQLVADYPDRFLWGSDTVGASQRPNSTPEADVFAQLKNNGFVDAVRNRSGDNYERFLRHNFDETIGHAEERVTRFRTDPENAAWLANGGPSVKNGLQPPNQWIQDNNGAWKFVPTKDLGAKGNRDTQIMPDSATPRTGASVIWREEAPGRWVPEPTNRNPFVYKLNPDRNFNRP